MMRQFFGQGVAAAAAAVSTAAHNGKIPATDVHRVTRAVGRGRHALRCRWACWNCRRRRCAPWCRRELAADGGRRRGDPLTGLPSAAWSWLHRPRQRAVAGGSRRRGPVGGGGVTAGQPPCSRRPRSRRSTRRRWSRRPTPVPPVGAGCRAVGRTRLSQTAARAPVGAVARQRGWRAGKCVPGGGTMPGGGWVAPGGAAAAAAGRPRRRKGRDKGRAQGGGGDRHGRPGGRPPAAGERGGRPRPPPLHGGTTPGGRATPPSRWSSAPPAWPSPSGRPLPPLLPPRAASRPASRDALPADRQRLWCAPRWPRSFGAARAAPLARHCATRGGYGGAPFPPTPLPRKARHQRASNGGEGTPR